MKQKLLLVFSFLLVTISMVAQESSDKKFSVEASYPISVNKDDLLGNGILDLGLKYRFADLKIVKLGVGLNGSFFTDKTENETFGMNFKTNNYLLQPKIFGEFTVPGLEKLKPSVGIGYSFVNSKNKGTFENGEINDSFNNNGLNLNLGVSYDITKSFFVQLQYDLIFLGENGLGYNREDLGALKLGVGFRF